jgi:colanic acid biosynthesis glycosyl transferase WcaI
MSLPSSLFQTDKRTLVILSQVFVPDPAAVGQYLQDVAREMAKRGWHVVVVTADRGYEQPDQRYASYEHREGVHVLRVPFASFGKGSIAIRLAGGLAFVSEATLLAAALPRVDRVLVSTSPPMCALAGLALSRLKRAPLLFWAMDINPDIAVAMGMLPERALPVRALDGLNRATLAGSKRVLVLDRFMAARLEAKLAIGSKLVVLPLWPQLEAAPNLPHADNPFRRAHGFGDARVVMYSGNLTPAHPITACLDAALALRDDPRLAFVFIGGGLGRAEIASFVERHRLRNVRMLPYQPLDALRSSLSAADLHLVAMGTAMVGCVHPSKIYGAMAVGRPILALGPRESHLGDLVDRHQIGWRLEATDTTAAIAALQAFLSASPDTLQAMGERARHAIASEFARSSLLPRFCSYLEE